MYNSDINWLPLSERKGFSMPTVVYEPLAYQSYSGYFEPGSNKLTIVERDSDFVACTIAHEFRHYMQEQKGLIAPKDNGSHLFKKHSYNKEIRLYFRTNWHEMDALLFETKVSPNVTNMFWLKGLVLPTLFDEEVCK